MRNLKNIGNFSLPFVVLLLGVMTWQLGAQFSGIENWILPTPLQIIKSAWQGRDLIWRHSLQTILETFLGFCVSIVIGVITATLIDSSRWLKRAVYPLLIISQTVPIIAIAPLFIIWFGYGLLPKVVVVTLVCFFPITINLVDGYRLVDRDMLHLMGAMGANSLQIFRKVKWPAALPFFFSGLRIAGTYSVMGAVIGEWLGAEQGLGVLMTRSAQSFLTDRVFATIFTIVIFSLIINIFLEGVAKMTIPWYYQDGESDT